MGQLLEVIDETLGAWLEQQPVFFVATAPLSADGHVNVSPKGYDTFRVMGTHQVGYLDLTGSGAETAAHLRENGRITLMFCSFAQKPRIVRLHGRGEVVSVDDERFPALTDSFSTRAGARAVILVHVDRVTTSCGYAVPLMQLEEERPLLRDWAERRGEAALVDYRREKNSRSVDGLPSFS